METWILARSDLFTLGIKICPRRSERRCPRRDSVAFTPVKFPPRGQTGRADPAETSPEATDAGDIADREGKGGGDGVASSGLLRHSVCAGAASKTRWLNSECVHAAAFGPVERQIGLIQSAQ